MDTCENAQDSFCEEERYMCPHNTSETPPKKQKVSDNEKQSVCASVCKYDEQNELTFSFCDSKLENVLSELAAGRCGCIAGYISTLCVFKTIKTWIPGKSVWCEGCFSICENQMGHSCMNEEYYGIKEDPIEKVKSVLLDKDNLDILQRRYNDKHDRKNIATETRFEEAMRVLIDEEGKYGKLYKELYRKDTRVCL
jgi:hypothetical protein